MPGPVAGTDNDTYTYDPVGNRLTKTGVSGGYAYDAADRMTSAGGVSYGYDNNGNQTSRGSDSYSWDAEDRLTSATVSSTTTTFAYNGDGLRDSRTQGSTTTFTWDVGVSIPQVLDDGSFKYVYGLNRIAEVGPGTTTHYYLPDGLGSTMALVDSSGAVVNSYDYDVFGAIRASTGSQANEFKFTGEQVDANTGLQYLRARYYDQLTGRLLAKDKISGLTCAPQTGNAFAYVVNNPVAFTDPSGLICLKLKCAKDKIIKPIGNWVADPAIQLDLMSIIANFGPGIMAAGFVSGNPFLVGVGATLTGANFGAFLAASESNFDSYKRRCIDRAEMIVRQVVLAGGMSFSPVISFASDFLTLTFDTANPVERRCPQPVTKLPNEEAVDSGGKE